MASGKNTREYLTIRRNLSLIIDSLAATVDPARLAVKLLEVDLIPHDVVDHASVVGVLSARQRIQPIVLALESQIQLDVSNYQVLMRVLRTIHPCLAERLEKFYTSDLELNIVNAVTDVHDWQTLAQQLDYDPIHQQELRTSGQNQDHCRKEMLTTWVRKDPRASWRKLAEALDRMEQQQAAQRIREEFIPAIDTQDRVEKMDGKEVETPTPTPAINRYGDYLRRIYNRRLLPYERKYSPKSTQKYINLAMISKHKESRAELDAFTRATIRGDVDDVVETKTAITPQDIGRLEDGSPAECVLIQGAPGVGKTTLAWEVCRQWGNGALFSEYLLVVLLKMRDQNIQKATTLSDLFKHPDPELQAAVCKDVVERNGKSILILLEGYDELPPDIQERSIFSALIEGKELPNATILVTSRTSSSDIVYTICKTTKFQHVEVVGFTGEQIESYIENTVADEKVLEAFRHYLKKYPHIHGLMYIPLNCGIILDVFISRCNDEEPPTTQTELYTVLTKTILYRYLSSHPLHGKQKWRLSGFSDLPQDVHSNFLQLCKVAYEGILSNHLIFSDIPADQETLGLMQSVPELYESTATSAVSHNFLHLTLQEFLSAVHISAFSQHVFVETLENMFGKKHLAVVLRFLAGLTKLAPQKGSFTSKVRAFFSKSPIQCVKSLQRDTLGFVNTMHWLFEAQKKELLSEVLGRNIQDRNLSSQFLSPFDCYALGYCIANSQCTWKLNLKSCSITEEGMSMIASNGDGSFRGVSVLNLDRNSIGNQGGTALSIALKDSAVLGELRLGLCSIGPEGITKLTETLRTIHTLQVLDISGSAVGLTAEKNVAQILTIGSLRELNVSYCSIESDTTCDLARALHGNSQLRDLRLGGNPIEQAGAEAIASMLQHNNRLKFLDLTGCSTIGETGVLKLIASMCQNVSLKVLRLPDNLRSTGRATDGYDSVQPRIQWTSDIITQEVVELRGDINSFIVSALRLNSVLTKLTLVSVDAGGIAKLAAVLSELSTLKTLELKRCKLGGSSGAKHLATALRGNHVLTDLILENCGIDSTAMSQLQKGIFNQPALSVLNLSWNKLGTEGARHLATVLRGIHELTDLILDHCDINGTVMSHLHEGISSQPTLKVLSLRWNKFGTEGARHLATALRGIHELTDLILDDCDINGTAISHLHEGISSQPTLKVLSLRGNTLGTEGARHLATAFRRIHDLTDLILDNCDIDSTAMSHLHEGISSQPTLKVLSLSSNTLGTEGARHLTTALRGIHDLAALTLRACGINSTAMSHLHEGISNQPILRILDMSFNIFRTEGARHLATALRGSHALTDLKLMHCGIDGTALPHLLEGSTIPTLRVLDLGRNSLGTEGTMHLAAAMRGSHTLTDLLLKDCDIDGTALSHLLEGISTIPTLRVLDLKENSLGTEGARHLAQLLKSSCSLTELDLGDCDLGGAADVTRLLEALRDNTTVTKLTLSSPRYEDTVTPIAVYSNIKHRVHYYYA